MNKIVIKGRIVYKHDMVKIVKKNIDDSKKKNLENPEFNLLFNMSDIQV